MFLRIAFPLHAATVTATATCARYTQVRDKRARKHVRRVFAFHCVPVWWHASRKSDNQTLLINIRQVRLSCLKQFVVRLGEHKQRATGV